MRILFAYFDFSAERAPFTLRSLGECALNLSTDYDFFVKKKVAGEVNGRADSTYVVSRSRKPAEECIKDGFWGERIYSITAIVGGNGAGKSTILRSMIRVVVERLDPGVPFLLVLQETSSPGLSLYYGNGYFEPEETWDDLKRISCEYPKALKYTKTMLIDNTLSYASIDLDYEYEQSLGLGNDEDEQDMRPVPVYEDRKQFINKSLVASIRYSNDMAAAGFPKSYEPPVRNALAFHFRYEAYQETRFLFDRFQQENINALSDGGFSIPTPRYLLVNVLFAGEVYARCGLFHFFDSSREEPMPKVCRTLEAHGFIGSILADALLNLYAEACAKVGSERVLSLFELAHVGSLPYDACDIAMQVLQRVVDYGLHDNEHSQVLEDAIKNVRKFVEFVVENKQTLEAMFEPLESGDFRVDILSTVADEQKRRCMIDFLDRYRPASDPVYFLVFSSGMSSGEKNFLRMMTQFRYALSGPSVYADGSTEGDTGCKLVNGITKEDERTCDTLFLFLDEADLTYHPEWQRIFVSKLTSILPRMFRDPYNKDKDPVSGCKDIQVILATHSPLMLGDFPKASVHYLLPATHTQSQQEGKGQHVPQRSTFGENLYTILQDSFFMQETVGEFAKRKINAAAKWCVETAGTIDDENGEMHKAYEEHRQTAELLPRGIIRSKLIAELEKRRKELGIERSRSLENRLRETMEQNDELRRKLEQANQRLREAGLLDE